MTCQQVGGVTSNPKMTSPGNHQERADRPASLKQAQLAPKLFALVPQQQRYYAAYHRLNTLSRLSDRDTN